DEPQRRETALSVLLRKQATIAGNKGGSRSDDVDDDFSATTTRKKRGAGKPPLLWFSSLLLPRDHFFGAYRAIFTNEELQNEDNMVDNIKRRQLAPLSAPKPVK